VVHDQGVSPGLGNPNKLANLRPGLGAEGRRKHVRSIANKIRRYLESHKKRARDSQGRNRLARDSRARAHGMEWEHCWQNTRKAPRSRADLIPKP